jgi:AmmeMemoRadiSam system protein A
VTLREAEIGLLVMAPLFSNNLSESEQNILLSIARQSIDSGLTSNTALLIDSENLDDNLLAPLGVFVTLTKSGALRGCIGSVESTLPLAQAVANAAFSTAFRDPRFPPLEATEVDILRIEISVLSALEPIAVNDRADLLAQLKSGQDGLVLEDSCYRSIFLPKVWEMVSSPEEFLDQLLLKAGLPVDHWSEKIRFKLFSAFSFAG